MDATALLPREQKFFKEIRRIVEEHFPEHDFNVSTLCTHLGKSRVTLYRMLIKTPHQSAVQLIRDTRLKHALSLLKEGEVNVREVAANSGFHNHSYFTKCFRRQYGMNPSEFIRQTNQTSWARQSNFPKTTFLRFTLRNFPDVTYVLAFETILLDKTLATAVILQNTYKPIY